MSRVAAEIGATSYWQRLYNLGYLSIIIAIAFVVGLPWWLIMIVIVVSMIVFIVSSGKSQQPVHISSADPEIESSHWQLVYAGRVDELWEAKLIKAKSFSHFIQFTFETVHPAVHTKTVVLWKDQIEAEAWRQFKALSRWQA